MRLIPTGLVAAVLLAPVALPAQNAPQSATPNAPETSQTLSPDQVKNMPAFHGKKKKHKYGVETESAPANPVAPAAPPAAPVAAAPPVSST